MWMSPEIVSLSPAPDQKFIQKFCAKGRSQFVVLARRLSPTIGQRESNISLSTWTATFTSSVTLATVKFDTSIVRAGLMYKFR
jgi:hypothetical protein